VSRIRITSHQLFQQPIGFQPAVVDRPAGQVHTLRDLTVRHFQEPVHQKDIPVVLRQGVQRIGQQIVFDQDHITAKNEGVVLPGITVIGRKLLHCVLRQFAERDAVLLPAADLSIAIAGLALQDLFTKAVKGVLLVFGVAIRFHVLTSLRAGRQFFSSPFAHYSFCGRLFWPALPGKIKIIFSVAHLCAPFVLIGWVAGSGKGRSAGTVETSPITTKSACLQNADRRRRIIKSIYMISVFILIAGIVRWRGYAFFNWCRSWTLRKSKKDTAIPPRYRRVLKKGRL